MMNSDTCEVKEAAETVDACAKEPKKRKKRTEGRPHKRLLEPLLVKRKDDVRRKLEIHKAKCILSQSPDQHGNQQHAPTADP